MNLFYFIHQKIYINSHIKFRSFSRVNYHVRFCFILIYFCLTFLQQNPCQHPIIILRDVAFVDVSALLSFVYQGEVYVSQERLTAFLHTAELLHIKGLTDQHHHTTTHNGGHLCHHTTTHNGGH